MQVLSLIWGILAIVLMLIGLFPCLGALNWLIIPFAGIGVIISAVALGSAGNMPNGNSIAGLVLCIVVVFVGIIRLIVGGGVF